jgi:hypothetical protein
MKKRLIFSIVLLLCISFVDAAAIIADHNAIVAFDNGDIPAYWIEQVKSQNMTIHMPGESHGNQLYGVLGDSSCPGGLELLETSSGGTYNVEIECNYSSLNEGNALRILKGQYKSGSWQGGTTTTNCRTGEQDYWSDSDARTMTLGSATRANIQGDPLDASMYAWCWDIVRPDYCYDESSNRITYNSNRNDAYLNAISTFNANPTSGGTKYVYTTAVTDDDWTYNPPDYTTEHGYRVTLYNALIRQAAGDNDAYLFDLADIENWNNANTEEYDDYSYNSLTLEIRNPEYDTPETCGHSNELLHVRKAKALWWMAARMAGWDGTPESGAPTVSTISSSTLTHEGSYIINGSNFGVKTQVAPLVWENFENGQNGTPIPETGYWNVECNVPPCPVYSNEFNRDNSNLNAKIYIEHIWNQIQAADLDIGNDIYVNFYTRYDSGVHDPGDSDADPERWQIKYFGIAQDTGGTYPALLGHTFPSIGSPDSAYNLIQIYLPSEDGQAFNMDRLEDEEWSKVEHQIYQGTVGNYDGTVDSWTDGLLSPIAGSYDRYAAKFKVNPTDNLDTFRFGRYVGNGGIDATEYFDDIYIDNSWARILICDQSSWDDSVERHCEIQIPHTTWDGSNIQFVANQGSFVSGQDYYLYVIDENGEVSNSEVIQFSGVSPECVLNSASWGASEVEEGTQVSLTVTGTDCDGESVNFNILEYDTGVGNDDVTSQLSNPPGSVSFNGNTATQTWNAEWLQDTGIFTDDDPEFNFGAILDSDPGNSIQSADYLVVTQLVVGDPHINSVSNSGTLSDGGSFSIDGIYFGTKTPVEPLAWDNFDQNNLGDNLAGSTPVIGPDWGTLFASPVFVDEQIHSGDRSALVDFRNGIKRFEHDLDPYQSQVFMSWWRYHESNPEAVLDDVGCIPSDEPGYDPDDCHNFKMLYLMGNVGLRHDQPQIMIGAIMSTRQNWQHAIQVDPTINYGWETSYHYTETINQWQRWDTYAQTETGDFTQDNGILEAWLSGKKVLDMQNSDYGPTPHLWKDVGIGALFRPSGPYTKFQSFFDDVYIDNTRARIEICDTSSWSERETNGAHCEIQIPISGWDDGTGENINFISNQGAFVGGQTYYLFVIDENGVASNAVSVSFDGVAPVCPDGNIEPPEVCDGSNLGVETCISQGFDGGTLACSGDCLSFDTSGCTVSDCIDDGDCNDTNVCTDDVCNAGNCEYTNNFVSCDDSNSCTVGDICSAGSCGGTQITSCTNDDGCCPGSCTYETDSDCTEPLPNDAVLYLPFDSDYQDHSNSSLSVSCSPFCPSSIDGMVNGAYSFDGVTVNNSLDFGDNLNLDLPVSMAAWVYIDDDTRLNSVIRSDDDTSAYPYSGYWMVTDDRGTGNKVFVGYGDGEGPQSAHSRYRESNEVLEPDTWYHIAGVINGLDDIDVYVNGQEVGGSYAGEATSYATTDRSLSIGKKLKWGARYLAGDLDEVRIYDRALGVEEVGEIMTGETTATCTVGFDSATLVPANSELVVGGNAWIACDTNVSSGGTEALVEGIEGCIYMYTGAPTVEHFNCTNIGPEGIRDVVCYIDPAIDSQCGDNATVEINVQSDCIVTGISETICNGDDDDCDSFIDEDYVSIPTSCGVGVCAASGILSCNAGVEEDSCVENSPSGISESICNGDDDDCDSSIDEDYAPSSTNCGFGVCVASGTLSCSNGVEEDSCVEGPQTGADADCNNIDEDCDGVADDNYVSTSTTCGVGVCGANGTLSCNSGVEEDSCIEGPQTGPDDDCDGLDDDCDKSIDEDYLVDASCFLYGVCSVNNTASSCLAGSETVCQTGSPTEVPETSCDGLDNDCDDSTDEDCSCTDGEIQTCGSTDIGECSYGNQTCSGGSWGVCDGEVIPSAELCDGFDNNCDDSIDEGDVCIVSQTILLVPGWNVVSLDIDSVLSSSDLGADFVLRYENGWETDWAVVPGDSFTLEPLRGYYAYSDSGNSILVEGASLNHTAYDLVENTWNLYNLNETGVSYGQEVYSVSSDGSGFDYSVIALETPLNSGYYWIQVGDTVLGPPFETSNAFGGLFDWVRGLFTPVSS